MNQSSHLALPNPARDVCHDVALLLALGTSSSILSVLLGLHLLVSTSLGRNQKKRP